MSQLCANCSGPSSPRRVLARVARYQGRYAVLGEMGGVGAHMPAEEQ